MAVASRTRDLGKLRLYRLTLIDRRNKRLSAHQSVGAVERELVQITMRIIMLELREQKQTLKAAA